MKNLMAFLALGLCCLVLDPQAWAEGVNRQLPFSKQVTLTFPKTYLFKMELCIDAACTDTVYVETKKIALKSATLSFSLGAGTPDPTSQAFDDVDFSQQYWLRISRSSATGFVALGPPSKLAVVPYALWSNQVEGVGAGVGTITGVYGGDGLNGSATSGAATLSVGAGSGIQVEADAVSIAAGGVTGAHIQDGAVTNADIADGTVSSADIANGTVTGADILDDSVSAADMGFTFAGSTTKGGAALDSDLVDGKHADSLRPRLAFNWISATWTPLGSTCVNRTSVTIQVPTSGTIVVEHSVLVGIQHVLNTVDNASFSISSTGTECPPDGPFTAKAYVGYAAPTDYTLLQIHGMRSFVVSAGTYTYYLNGRMYQGDGNGDAMHYAAMKAVFYPN